MGASGGSFRAPGRRREVFARFVFIWFSLSFDVVNVMFTNTHTRNKAADARE